LQAGISGCGFRPFPKTVYLPFMQDVFGAALGTKPFLKWAGGKTQLWPQIRLSLPEAVATPGLTYVEPFLGGGAVLFKLLAEFPKLGPVIANDINPALCRAYSAVQQQVEALIEVLLAMQDAYDRKCSEAERRTYFEELRAEFNQHGAEPVRGAALLIALNKTCFNGLYRVNRNGGFNVPFGKYDRPRICDPHALRRASAALQSVTLLTGDYAATLPHIAGPAFFYLDPPYKPVSATANFNAYAPGAFGDEAQRQLAAFCHRLSEAGHYWLLSNSDALGGGSGRGFFDDLYQGCVIQRVPARRAINSNGSARGEVSELLISNYRPPRHLFS
jgi:DNA adenine methylase